MSDKLIAAHAKLEKLTKKVERHQSKISKLTSKLSTLTNSDDICWIQHDIEFAQDDLKRAEDELKNYTEYVSKLEVKIQEKEEKSKIPAIFMNFKNTLVSHWNEFDKNKRDSILSQGQSFYKINGEFNWYKWNEYDRMQSLTDKQIEKRNEEAAIDLIWNLIHRVEKKVGKIKNFDNLHIADGNFWNDGGVAINGYVEGEGGNCEVKSILSGGYNIQRLHVRVLVQIMK